MIAVSVFKESVCPLSDAFIKKIARSAARYEKKIHGRVEITFVTNKKIQKLNAEFRGKNKPTDVLSFPWDDEKKARPFLGQLFLSYRYIAAQAKRFNVSASEESARMLIHGLLHLVGHDHINTQQAKKMFAIQEKAVLASKNK